MLLVHGYNVSERQAKKSFTRFEEIMKQHLSTLVENCCWVFWPGDAYIPGVRTLAYPFLVKNATACAAELADYLIACKASDHRPSEIVLIGHSLGCRLIIEALAILAEKKKQKHLKEELHLTVILMAAAVPVTLVCQGGSLYEGLSISSKRFIFFSRYDSVLKYVFSIGQRLARDGLDPPLEAVGLWGHPSTNVWTRTHEAPFHGHVDYWTSRIVVGDIAHLLKASIIVPIADRLVPIQLEPFERTAGTERLPPDERQVRQRRL
jgi:hypothetical protein